MLPLLLRLEVVEEDLILVQKLVMVAIVDQKLMVVLLVEEILVEKQVHLVEALIPLPHQVGGVMEEEVFNPVLQDMLVVVVEVLVVSVVLVVLEDLVAPAVMD